MASGGLSRFPRRAVRPRQRRKAVMESVGLWQENGLVFTTYMGTALDAANVPCSFQRICGNAKIGEKWT